MPTDTATKTCSTCGEAKSTSEFHKNPKGKGGRHSQCKECIKASRRARYEENRDKVLAYQARHYLANQARILAKQADYYQSNKAKIVAYRRARPHIYWEFEYRRRCAKYGLTPVIESFTRDDVINQYGNRCAYCPDGAFEELDHFIPVAAGGPHTLANCRPACRATSARTTPLTVTTSRPCAWRWQPDDHRGIDGWGRAQGPAPEDHEDLAYCPLEGPGATPIRNPHQGRAVRRSPST